MVIAEEVAEGLFFAFVWRLRCAVAVFNVIVTVDGVGIAGLTQRASLSWRLIVACWALNGISDAWRASMLGTVRAVEQSRP